MSAPQGRGSVARRGAAPCRVSFVLAVLAAIVHLGRAPCASAAVGANATAAAAAAVSAAGGPGDAIGPADAAGPAAAVGQQVQVVDIAQMVAKVTAAVTAEGVARAASDAARAVSDAATAATLKAIYATIWAERTARHASDADRNASDAARDALDAARNAAREKHDASLASNISAFMLRDAESKAETDARIASIASNISAVVLRDAESKAETDARIASLASNISAVVLRDAESKAETDVRIASLASNYSVVSEMKAAFVTMMTNLDEMKAAFVTMMTNIDEMKAIVIATKVSVDEILESSPTTSSAARVAGCATNATFFVAAPISCSAFAYAPPDAPPGEAPVFLTAAHCLTGPNGENLASLPMQLHSTSGSGPLYCVAEKVFSSPEDAVVLVCAGAGVAAAGASALSRAVDSPHLGLSVVAAGFVTDAFGGLPQFSLPLYPLISVKLTFSRVSNAAGHWNNESCDVAHTGPATRPPWTIEPGGFFDGLVTRGMSGGPVINLRCGVIGITHGKGCESSIFARLDAVDKYLRGDRSKAKAAAKAAAAKAAVEADAAA